MRAAPHWVNTAPHRTRTQDLAASGSAQLTSHLNALMVDARYLTNEVEALLAAEEP